MPIGNGTRTFNSTQQHQQPVGLSDWQWELGGPGSNNSETIYGSCELRELLNKWVTMNRRRLWDREVVSSTAQCINMWVTMDMGSHQLQATDLNRWSTSIGLAMDTCVTSIAGDGSELMINVNWIGDGHWRHINCGRRIFNDPRRCVRIQPYQDKQVGAGKFRDKRTNRTSVLGRVYAWMYLPWAGENFVDV